MFQDSRSGQVKRIVEALAAMPGSSAVNITAKKFPRWGPAEPGSMYEEQTRSFRTDAIPDSVVVQPDADEILITLSGSLEGNHGKSELVQKLTDFFDTGGIDSYWDVRAKFMTAEENRRKYELTVFTNPPLRNSGD